MTDKKFPPNFWDFDYMRHRIGGSEVKPLAMEGGDLDAWTMTTFTETVRGNDPVRLREDLVKELDSIAGWLPPDNLPSNLVEWQLTWDTMAYDPSPHFARLIVMNPYGTYLWTYDSERTHTLIYHS